MSLSNQELESTNTRAKSKWKDFVVGVSGLLFYLVAFVGIIFLLMFLIRGGTWVAANIYPTVSIILATFVLIAIPTSLVLAIFKKSRGIGSIGLLISSYALGLNLWLSSLIMAYTFAGTFWLIVGLLFGGIGVVPIAFIATLISGKWSIAGQILLMAAIVYGVRASSHYLSKRADNNERL
jgi:hypothetical protein